MLLTDPLGDDLLLVRLNRPERLNALSQPLIAHLADALARADTDSATRGVVEARLAKMGAGWP